MEFVSLELENFGCVARAALAFKPGLNVLYGSNEVGKSSIARAIRFALLLPASSSAAEPWIPWVGSGDPTVSLAFRKTATEYYRVKKVFGTTTASLERSSDGVGWSSLARAREVEAQLRGLLQWGIPEPGGAKAPKGLPESFLASALLADQDAVTGIFDQDLDADGVDSGRARIRAALSAIAQDPLFKSALDAAQIRVDYAFAPNGQRKRGAKDPFRRMADEITARRGEHETAAQEAVTSRALAQRVDDLQKDAVRAEGDLQDAIERRVSLDARRARHVALAVAIAALKNGQGLVDAVTEASSRFAAAKRSLDDWEPRLPSLRKADEDTRKTFEATTARASTAKEKRRGELAQEETAILRARDALRERREHAEAGLALIKADDLSNGAESLTKQIAGIDEEIATLDAVDSWLELRNAQSALADVDRREKESGELLTNANGVRERISKEWPSAASASLPAVKRLDDLRKLRGKLDVAEGKLAVGLSIAVRGAPSTSVAVDGGVAFAKSGPFSIEASASAHIVLPDGAEITVRGGRADDRASVEKLRSQWREATAELFATVHVADLDALEEACRADGERKARAEALGREASILDAKRIALGDPSADRHLHSSRVAELDGRLGDADRAAIETAIAAHGTGLRGIRTARHADRESKREALATMRGQEASLRERAGTHAGDRTVTDTTVEIAVLEAEAQELDAREARIAADRKVLDAPRGKRDALEDAADAAREALRDAVARVAAATSERDIWGARLQERGTAVTSIELHLLKAAEAEARAAVGDDSRPVDDASIAGARAAEEMAEKKHEMIVSELLKAEGGLLASGGTAADELVHDFEVALRRAYEKQSALEDDYEAWKLLADTLKEAERNQATHLGNVLAPELATRFQALAGARYSGVALGPHLSLDGIDAAGGRRDLERLSIGTREQLSTLFRLCLAERLGSALLLDDQLVQSDPDRLRWFRRALRETAKTGVQIVVLTCRPDDYLEPAEIPPPHIIDLGVVVKDRI
jgi:hypothetical protein